MEIQHDNSGSVPRCLVEGTLEELLAYMIPKIRTQDVEFYKKSIPEDIHDKYFSLVDSRVAGGVRYILKLSTK